MNPIAIPSCRAAFAIAIAAASVFASATARSEDVTVAALLPATSATSSGVPDVYQAALRQAIGASQHYPNSREARQLRPEGTVSVWMDLDRDGRVLASGVRTPSGSPLLDSQAELSVRHGRFPAPPAELLAGRASRRFAVAIEYRPGGSD